MKSFKDFLQEEYMVEVAMVPIDIKKKLMAAFRQGRNYQGSFTVADKKAIEWLNKTLGGVGSGNVLDLRFATAVFNTNSQKWVLT